MLWVIVVVLRGEDSRARQPNPTSGEEQQCHVQTKTNEQQKQRKHKAKPTQGPAKQAPTQQAKQTKAGKDTKQTTRTRQTGTDKSGCLRLPHPN
jgi:hypothetical protein